jgi:hypothetical protein
MAITRTAMIDDDGSGTTGTIINNAWKTELYNQIDSVVAGASGAWVDVVFNAGYFTTPTAGATWVVSAATYHYALIGKVVNLSLSIPTSTVTGAPVRFNVVLPLVPNRTAGVTYWYRVGSLEGAGIAFLNPGVTYMDFLRDVVGQPFPAGATQLHVQACYSIA